MPVHDGIGASAIAPKRLRISCASILRFRIGIRRSSPALVPQPLPSSVRRSHRLQTMAQALLPLREVFHNPAPKLVSLGMIGLLGQYRRDLVLRFFQSPVLIEHA